MHPKALAARFAIALCGRLPLSFNQALGGWVGERLYRKNARVARVTRRNLELCYPQQDEHTREQWTRESLREMGKTGAELGLLWHCQAKTILALVQQVEGLELLDQAIAKGRGVMLAVPHFGSWELIGFYLTAKGYVYSALYRPPRLKALDEVMHKGRSRLGAQLHPANAQGVRQQMKALARKEIVAILPDQEPSRDSGVFADFMGIPALTMTLMSKMVQRKRVPVLFVTAQRLPSAKGFNLRFFAPEEQIYDSCPEASAAALNRAVEQSIRPAPVQYAWSYKRFFSRPDGSEMRY